MTNNHEPSGGYLVQSERADRDDLTYNGAETIKSRKVVKFFMFVNQLYVCDHFTLDVHTGNNEVYKSIDLYPSTDDFQFLPGKYYRIELNAGLNANTTDANTWKTNGTLTGNVPENTETHTYWK